MEWSLRAVIGLGMALLIWQSRPSASSDAQCRALSAARGTLQRLYVIGDVHGDRAALHEVLVDAGVTEDADCTWTGANAVVVQLGDVVDRGPDSEGANACLRTLQKTAPKGSVVRLAGNHETCWAEGDFRFVSATETPAVRQRAVRRWIDEVAEGAVVGAHAAGPLLFTHAGFRPQMLAKLGVDDSDPERLAAHLAKVVTSSLADAVADCAGLSCRFEGDLFSAGPDRGGRGVGGPFWTDFSVLADADALPPGLVQVVGHSAARCSLARNPKCQPIRARNDLAALVADAGLSVAYASNRAYLVIKDARLIARTKSPQLGWQDHDLTADFCASFTPLDDKAALL